MTHAHDDSFGEFAQELRALAETLLERLEPALRRAAADGREWDSCSWCPVCAAAALVRGEHHEVVAAVADHGTAIVTVLREALAGVPVEPLLPDDVPDVDDESGEYDSAATEVGADPSSERTEHDGWIAGGAAGDPSDAGAGAGGSGPGAEAGGSGSGADRRAKGVRRDVPGNGRAGAAEAAPGAKPAPGEQQSTTRRGGRRAAERAGRGRDSVERPGYVPISVRIKK
ncbi:hypothetical protein [Nocardia africana]|uniref:hypothetical protein n=1 Tax=Nocardia africana TaxID=134964 RepID=UPI000A94E9F6|nr:hypothetical protein [Nocardia africana]MCC3314641.1 hypothetical protein [Nocardia africana]